MFSKKRSEDERVLSFMNEGLNVEKKSPLGPLRTFARVETGATTRGIPPGAIEAQEENEGVVFTKPVYRLAPTPVAVCNFIFFFSRERSVSSKRKRRYPPYQRPLRSIRSGSSA